MKRILIFSVVLVVVLLCAFYPQLMLNPGPLTEGHQKIKGDCFACHKAFGGIASDRCLQCHKLEEIGRADSTKSKMAFHDKLGNQECVSCHSDHKGMHPARAAISHFDHGMLASGLSLNCSSCHAKPPDALHEQLPLSCKSCHATESWTFSGTFDHELILGANKTNCISCHQKPSDSFHQSLQIKCDKCHTNTAWKPSTFDHSSYFLLDADHNVACTRCHTDVQFKVYSCFSCHEHSESKIAGKHREEGISDFKDCVSCHKSANEHDIQWKGRGRTNGESKEKHANQKENKASEGDEGHERDKHEH